ncbi:GNAT family N-acetyltransferase [Deinococcus aquiradiocola]|uniref:GNAT family N-acetyltransferase n=1 Tax=Deinococcus aquiradiocola TaxID=393059 RepID=A0A917UPX0_9DEIO|nr:GNAT family N-acetyltransferase [Deinococcus aquiradiocola]
MTGDAEGWVRLTNLARGHALSVERFLQGELREGSAPWRVVAVTGGAQGETVVGVAELRAFPYIPAGWRQVTLAVTPDGRGCGVGRALEGAVRAEVERLQGTGEGPAGLAVNARDDDPDSRAWAERRGFALHAHRFASELDLRAAQPGPEWPDGVRVRDMTRATGADWARLEGMYADLLLQTPDLAGQPRWTPEQVRASVRDERSLPEWLLIAQGPPTPEGDGEWLGVCQGTRISTGIYNEFTAVLPGARGQGLARALKLELVRRAQQAGVTSMRTNNHAANAPMLAVNRRLGFRPLSGMLELWRALP